MAHTHGIYTYRIERPSGADIEEVRTTKGHVWALHLAVKRAMKASREKVLNISLTAARKEMIA